MVHHIPSPCPDALNSMMFILNRLTLTYISGIARSIAHEGRRFRQFIIDDSWQQQMPTSTDLSWACFHSHMFL